MENNETQKNDASGTAQAGADANFNERIPAGENREEGGFFSALEEAMLLNSETKDTLKLIADERKKIERIIIENAVTGRGFAGMGQVQETPEQKYKREAKIRYAGTGMSPVD